MYILPSVEVLFLLLLLKRQKEIKYLNSIRIHREGKHRPINMRCNCPAFWECFSCCASYKNYNYLFKIESRGLRQFIISCYICKYRYTQEYRDLYFLSSITIAKPKSILI